MASEKNKSTLLEWPSQNLYLNLTDTVELHQESHRHPKNGYIGMVEKKKRKKAPELNFMALFKNATRNSNHAYQHAVVCYCNLDKDQLTFYAKLMQKKPITFTYLTEYSNITAAMSPQEPRIYI